MARDLDRGLRDLDRVPSLDDGDLDRAREWEEVPTDDVPTDDLVPTDGLGDDGYLLLLPLLRRRRGLSRLLLWLRWAVLPCDWVLCILITRLISSDVDELLSLLILIDEAEELCWHFGHLLRNSLYTTFPPSIVVF